VATCLRRGGIFNNNFTARTAERFGERIIVKIADFHNNSFTETLSRIIVKIGNLYFTTL